MVSDPGWLLGERGRQALAEIGADPGVRTVSVDRHAIRVDVHDDAVAMAGERLQAGDVTPLVPHRRHAGRTYLVDFCDPNVTKALHLGHLRNIALGHSLASVFSSMAARVLRQSVVCDMGRSVCEAMAGVMLEGLYEREIASRHRLDRVVGDCYAGYVARGARQRAAAGATGDAPVARELSARADLAERLRIRWEAGEAVALQLWRRIRSWVLAGQGATLERLGVAFDRLVFESDAIAAARRLAREGLARGVFRRGEHGAIVYETQRPEYPLILLVRPDGFPTEHMRAVALWCGLQQRAPAVDTCIHVMGQEWTASTRHRPSIVSAFVEKAPLYRDYRCIAHGMVVVDGTPMKSSEGGTCILVDDALDELSDAPQVRAWAGEHAQSSDIVRILALGSMLQRHPNLPLHVRRQTMTEARGNPAWTWVSSWIEALRHADGDARPEPGDREYRFAILHAQCLAHYIARAGDELDPRPVSRYLTRLAQGRRADDRSASINRAIATTFSAGFASIGLLPAAA